MTNIRYFFSVFFFVSQLLIGQVGFGTNTNDTSAALDLSSTTKGFYPPRMTYTQMTSIVSPTVGLMLYCTDCEPEGIYYYENGYFLNSHRQAVSGNLDSVDVSSFSHDGDFLDDSPIFDSDGITTIVNSSGWTGGRAHNPISFSSTGRLGLTATLIALAPSGDGVLENGTIPDSQISASSSIFTPIHGRLNTTSDWVAGTLNTSQWYQVDLGQDETVVGVATQGRSLTSAQQWIGSYKIQYSTNTNSTTFTDYNGGVVLTGNIDPNTVMRNNLNPTITARYIRFLPQTWNVHIAGRFEVYVVSQGSSNTNPILTFQITGKTLTSSSSNASFNTSIGGQTVTFSRFVYNGVPAGLENGTIPDSQISASSSIFTPIHGRLNTTSDWVAGTLNTSQWYQVDLGQDETVVGVATQGRSLTSAQQWIGSYKIQYSTNTNSTTFTDYNGGAVLTGNTNISSVIRHNFNPPITARYIRFHPQTWNGHIAGRFEVYIEP